MRRSLRIAARQSARAAALQQQSPKRKRGDAPPVVAKVAKAVPVPDTMLLPLFFPAGVFLAIIAIALLVLGLLRALA